ncbi:MAG: hypothetical protein NTZ72_03745 [Afipia sp.]|nr:hypothetical protein [Afipia sp.]
MVRPSKTKADLLWFSLVFALGNVRIGYRYKLDRAVTQAERHQVADDTIAEMRRHGQWKDLDDELPISPISDGAALLRGFKDDK